MHDADKSHSRAVHRRSTGRIFPLRFIDSEDSLWGWHFHCNYIAQSPSWEADRSSASHPAFYGTRRFITAFTSARHLSLYWANQSTAHPPSHFLKIHLNIILPSMPGSYKWSLSLKFPHQKPVYTSPLPHTCYMPRPFYFSRFYHPNDFWWEVQIIKLLII